MFSGYGQEHGNVDSWRLGGTVEGTVLQTFCQRSAPGPR